MRIRKNFTIILQLAAAVLLLASPLRGEQPLRITPLVEGLETPWAVAPLPEGGMLVTEREGRLIHAAEGRTRAIAGLPRIAVDGQGGLLDITLARDFATSRVLYLTYATPQEGGGSGTALARAVFPEGADSLQGLREIFVMRPGSSGGRHFGSRVVEGPDGMLYLTIGDRGEDQTAQELTRHNGSVIRIAPDGGIPRDNPYVGRDDALPETWSYGHRNPQGAGFDAIGRLWIAEHGARGGDEVNLVQRGANYGWPVISYGRHYSGRKIGEGTAKAGMEQPAFYWDPSIAPSGLLVRGSDIFVGSLKFDYISRLSGTPLREVEQIKTPETIRVRDIVGGPDGSIWFISEGRGTVYQLSR